MCAGRQGGARAGACLTVTVSGGSLAVRERAGRMPDTKVPLDRPSASGDADPTRMFASRSRAREWWQGRTRRERLVCVAGWCGEGVSVWQVEAALH